MIIERHEEGWVSSIKMCCEDMADHVLDGDYFCDDEGCRENGQTDWSFCPWCGAKIQDIELEDDQLFV